MICRKIIKNQEHKNNNTNITRKKSYCPQRKYEIDSHEKTVQWKHRNTLSNSMHAVPKIHPTRQKQKACKISLAQNWKKWKYLKNTQFQEPARQSDKSSYDREPWPVLFMCSKHSFAVANRWPQNPHLTISNFATWFGFALSTGDFVVPTWWFLWNTRMCFVRYLCRRWNKFTVFFAKKTGQRFVWIGQMDGAPPHTLVSLISVRTFMDIPHPKKNTVVFVVHDRSNAIVQRPWVC